MVEWGHRRQKQGLHCRKLAEAGMGPTLRALGWEEGVSRRCEAREARAESLMGHTIVLGGEGTGGAGALGEESLWPVLPPSRDCYVPH